MNKNRLAIMTAICGTLLTMTGCGGKTQEVPFDNGERKSKKLSVVTELKYE